MNDSFANDRKITKRIGRPSVTLHPADAASRGLGDGDMVRLSNATGTLELAVTVSDDGAARSGLLTQGPLARSASRSRRT